jgi:hypothetical protein
METKNVSHQNKMKLAEKKEKKKNCQEGINLGQTTKYE